MIAALKDAGLARDDIDAAFVSHLYQGEVLGQRILRGLRFPEITITNIENACAGGSSAVREGWLSIANGEHDVVLVIGAEKMGRGLINFVGADVELTLGNTAPAQYALAARRHMHEFGTTPETFARIGVKSRHHASLNPNARFRDSISLEEVMASRPIADPITLLQCCRNGSGAAAVILAAEPLCAERAGPKVWIESSALASWMADKEQRDLTSFGATRVAADAAYEAAGIGPEDIDLVELHDAFTTGELLHYEGLGLCAQGRGWQTGGRRRYHTGRPGAGQCLRRPSEQEPSAGCHRRCTVLRTHLAIARRGAGPPGGRCQHRTCPQPGRHRPRSRGYLRHHSQPRLTGACVITMGATTPPGIGITRLLDYPLARCPDKTAYIDDHGDITFAELERRAARLAQAFAMAGAQPGDRVAVILPNGIPFIVAETAMLRSGMVKVPLNIRFHPKEVLYSLADCEPSILVCDAGFADAVMEKRGDLPSLRQVFVVGAKADGCASYDEIVSGGDATSTTAPYDNDDPILIRYTGGTTGRPKGIVHTAASLLAISLDVIRELTLRHDDVALHLGHLSHGLNFMWAAYHSVGITQILRETFDPDPCWRISKPTA